MNRRPFSEAVSMRIGSRSSTTSIAWSASAGTPICFAKSFAVPSGTTPSGVSRPSSPLTTSLSVPSPPTATTTSTPRSAASAAKAAASPGSHVDLSSIKCPRSRTQFTMCRRSGRSARAPCTTRTICFLRDMTRMSAATTSSARWDSAYHAPVLVDEVVSLLRGRRTALDCTLGGGGHALALLESGVDSVTALDRDPEAIAAARARLSPFERAGRFRAILGNYALVDEIAELREERFDAVLLDLGVSSHQIDAPARGFSFREGAPLDMRMGTDAAETAAEILNARSERELVWVFKEYADEPRAVRLAREVVRRRQARPFSTSDDLVNAIRATLGPRA